MPGLGHIPIIVKCMSSSNDAVIKSAVQVTHLLSANEVRFFASAKRVVEVVIDHRWTEGRVFSSCRVVGMAGESG